MLNLNHVREHFDEVREALRKRGITAALEPFRQLDASRRQILGQVEALKQERNEQSREIGGLVRSGGDVDALKEHVRRLGDDIARLDAELGHIEPQLEALLAELPNLPHASVPEGSSSEDNPVVRTWGEPGAFDFEPKAHWDLGAELRILDFERAARMTGARFALYVGDGARLERALIQFMLELHREHGYVEVLPPFMVNERALYGTGQLPKFEQDLFRVEPGSYFLIPTAEVPVTNIHADEILESDLAEPIAYCAYTPCFRSEAGSYGKDVRGLIRQHQFNKVELVRFCRPEDSYAQLELLTRHAEEVLRRLELPYRVVTLCSGDLGFAAAKTYDLEVWLAGQGVYREISSCSNFEDFQARRAKIRYRPAAKAKPALVHTLNGSGLAVGRTFVALLENYQEADGSVVIPAALRPYLGGQERISRRG